MKLCLNELEKRKMWGDCRTLFPMEKGNGAGYKENVKANPELLTSQQVLCTRENKTK